MYIKVNVIVKVNFKILWALLSMLWLWSSIICRNEVRCQHCSPLWSLYVLILRDHSTALLNPRLHLHLSIRTALRRANLTPNIYPYDLCFCWENSITGMLINHFFSKRECKTHNAGTALQRAAACTRAATHTAPPDPSHLEAAVFTAPSSRARSTHCPTRRLLILCISLRLLGGTRLWWAFSLPGLKGWLAGHLHYFFLKVLPRSTYVCVEV